AASTAPKAALVAPPDVAAPAADALKTRSGLAMKVLRPGQGHVHPASTDCVRLNFTGWRRDGSLLTNSTDSNVECLEHAIPGVAEALQQMVQGEVRRVWIPAALGFANKE